MRWNFGVQPLPQVATAAALMRRITGLMLALEHEEAEVDRMVGELRRIEDALLRRVPPDPTPRVGAAISTDGRVYLDHARDVGAYNPCFPEYEIEVDADQARGSVRFPIAYEGPPGVVHGGFVAVFFDCAVQHHNCDVGVAGKTRSLALRYRRPVPLLTTLTFSLHRSVAEGRIRSTGHLLHDDAVLCEVEVEAAAADRAALPPVSPRRSAQ